MHAISSNDRICADTAFFTGGYVDLLDDHFAALPLVIVQTGHALSGPILDYAIFLL